MIEVAGSEIFCNSIMIHTNTERTCWHVMENFILYLALLQLVLKLKLKPIVHFAYCAWMWVLHEQKGWNRDRWVGLPAGCRGFIFGSEYSLGSKQVLAGRECWFINEWE